MPGLVHKEVDGIEHSVDGEKDILLEGLIDKVRDVETEPVKVYTNTGKVT